ncbi:hypothetical protein EJ06DRAFT_527417 [Trichodelitschia bisporula]|uniref:Uncharacterized protein n=1 Tax=Trichodelitschia bisporula TaxID=703511 RepID=A0A6G1I686_9PEZI|nr:hypothetical protein EJ06DRAFT_527417 [Trichodelitschia bisporula]
MTAKISALTLTLFPTLLLIPSFILSAYSTSHKDWTYRTEYSQSDHGSLGKVHRGPFVSCQLPALPNAIDKCQHTLHAGGLCDENSNSRADNVHFCRQLALGGRLLYAGNALLALALLIVLVLTALTLPRVLRSATGSFTPLFTRTPHHGRTELRRANHTPAAWLALLTRLCAGLSALALLIGTIITTNTLVNIQYPIGDWYTTGNPNNADIVSQDFAGPWLMGKAVGWAAAGAVLAGVAACMVESVWEGPRVGVETAVEEEKSA